MTRANIYKKIEVKQAEIRAIEAHLSTMSESAQDWAYEQIDKLIAEIQELQMMLAKI